MTRPIYLDCNATTPVDPRVADEVYRFMVEEFGNPGSRTHEYGTRAKKAIDEARRQVASVVGADPSEVIFTSGATESNNIALLGLAAHGEQTGKKHIVSTQIEHKAVIDPLNHLQKRGFDITFIPTTQEGLVDPSVLIDSIRADTLLVSTMNVNNETGVIQPISEIASFLEDRDVFFHTDAAQGFGKDIEQLKHPRIDMISISGHKIYGPKGVGALLIRKRNHKRPPISPISFGGGQEIGLRPGTVPTALVAGLGRAAELSVIEHQKRKNACESFRAKLLDALQPLRPQINGDLKHMLPNVVNLSFGTIDSEAVMLAIKNYASISNGSACTSSTYNSSHVLLAMGMTQQQAETATRWSWFHDTPDPDWGRINQIIEKLL